MNQTRAERALAKSFAPFDGGEATGRDASRSPSVEGRASSAQSTPANAQGRRGVEPVLAGDSRLARGGQPAAVDAQYIEQLARQAANGSCARWSEIIDGHLAELAGRIRAVERAAAREQALGRERDARLKSLRGLFRVVLIALTLWEAGVMKLAYKKATDFVSATFSSSQREPRPQETMATAPAGVTRGRKTSGGARPGTDRRGGRRRGQR